MKTLAIATAGLGLVFTATPALANPEPLPTVKVSAAGLDLNTLEGQRLLERRVDRAAREVCAADRVPTGSRIRPTDARECVAKARATAAQQMAQLIEDQRRGG